MRGLRRSEQGVSDLRGLRSVGRAAASIAFEALAQLTTGFIQPLVLGGALHQAVDLQRGRHQVAAERQFAVGDALAQLTDPQGDRTQDLQRVVVQQEWFNEAAYLRDGKPKPMVKKQRIATQRITGVDERLRLVAAIAPTPAYFADSTNSVLIDEDSSLKLNYVLAILNSRLMQWRFKLTSTNNNVGTNEIESLPFFNPKSEEDWRRHETIAARVDALTIARKQEVLSTGSARVVSERKRKALENEINKIVYQLYALDDADIALIENQVIP